MALRLYSFFKHRLLLLFGIVLLAFVAVSFFASKIKLEEDLNKFIPKDKKIDEINFVLKNLKIKDKLVLTIFNTDTSNHDTQNLMLCAETLNDTLLATHGNGYIKEISGKVSDNLVMQLYGTFYQNLPIFLNKNDYRLIDQSLAPDSLKRILKSDYQTLLSPSSFVLGKFIQKDPLSITGLALKKMQNLQFDENFEVNDGYVMTKDGKNLMLFITPAIAPNETEPTKRFFSSLDNIIEQLSAQYNHQISIQYYGAPAVSLGNSIQIRNDSITTSIVALICIILLLGLFFKRITVIIYVLLPVVFGALFSISLLYFIKHEISAIALGAGSIVLGIAINYSLHFFTHYKHEKDIKKVITDLSLPMLIGCTTTVGAFFSLLFAKSQALHDFGLFAGFSLIGAMLFSIVVLPHLLSIKTKKGAVSLSTENHTESWIDKVATYPFDKNKILVFTSVLLTIVFAYTSRNVSFESDMLKLNYQSEKLQEAQNHLDKINNFSLSSVYVIAKGKNLNEALKANEKANEKLGQLYDQKVITKYSSISNLLLSDSLQKLRINEWNTYWTAEKKDSLISRLKQYGKTYKFKEDAFSSFYTQLNNTYTLVPSADLDSLKKLIANDFITKNAHITTIVTLVKVSRENKNQVYEIFKNNASIIVFDKQYMASQFVEIISSDFNLILIITGILVFAFMLLSHGRIELAIINFMPMAISWIWILGIMGLFGLKFNIINIIISTFIFGLGDDYSIFIMDGLSHQYKYGKKTLNSYKTSILLSAITTIIGIGVLIFAKHPALKSIALITIIGMVSVLLISYIVQPLCYNFLILNRKKRGLLPYTAFNLFITFIGFLFFTLGSILLTVAGIILFTFVPIPLKRKKLLYHYLIMYVCRMMIGIFANSKNKIINTANEQLHKPAIIICNHQSHIDLALTLMLHPKIIVFTNDWVWNSPFYGRIVKMADFYPASQGYEAAIDKIKNLMLDGYSVLIFPEGTRSVSGDILRFHKGAFYLAEVLQVDILPLLIHGAGDAVTKGDFHFKSGSLTVKYLPRIKPEDLQYGGPYKDRSKNICAMMRIEYQNLKNEQETVHYFRQKLISNYIYKGPLLEWYCKIKVKFENNYELFDSLLPKAGKIVDVGCGYGFLSLMLSFKSNKRQILGIDYDEEKIEIAANCISKSNEVNFAVADVTQFDYEPADAFIISDVLHYLNETQQTELIVRCAQQLNNNGIMIIRDADADKKQRHWGTRYTEFFSTNSGFNKTKKDGLHFTSSALIKNALNQFPSLDYEILDNTKLTSNIIFVARKRMTNGEQ